MTPVELPPPAPPFFVVGAYRSGTTLLRLMLNKHSRLCVPPESHFIVEIFRALKGAYHRERFWEALKRHARFAELALDPVETRRRVEGAPASFAASFHEVFSCYAEQRGKARWGDKTPEYVRHLDVLQEIFPRAQVIHLIRDGRDVACSLRGVPWFHGDVEKAARRWKKRVQRGRRHGARMGAARYFELRYEDLVSEPETWLRRICAFLDERFEEPMLRFHESAEEEIPEHRRAWHTRTSRPVSSERVSRWRNELGADEVARFEETAGGLLRQLGYPTQRSSAWRSLLHSLRGWFHPA